MNTHAVNTMRELVLNQMHAQRKLGKLSKAHAEDHVENVARYSGVFAEYLAKKLGIDPVKASNYAQMDGWSHDVVRYASQTDSGEEASARLLESLYSTHFKDLPRDEYQRLVVDVVRNSDRNFADMQKIYADDSEALAVALALVAGDKLIEASGPRVLERRAFFVGKERMLNKKDDLGLVFHYPFESHLGILSETFVRLGDVNHVSNYASHPALLKLAQELHGFQYQWYKGLLSITGVGEEEALDKIVSRLQPLLKLAARTEKGGRRLVTERHLDGTYFEQNNLDSLLNTVRGMPDGEDLRDSSYQLVHEFVRVDSPEEAIEIFRNKPFGPPTFRKWMNAIIDYRKGKFADRLLASLEA